MTWVHRVETFDGRILGVIEEGPCPWCFEPKRHSHQIPADPKGQVGAPVIILQAVPA